MESTDERIEIIKAAFDKAKQEKALDLDNVSFAAISDADNDALTNAEQVYIDSD